MPHDGPRPAVTGSSVSSAANWLAIGLYGAKPFAPRSELPSQFDVSAALGLCRTKVSRRLQEFYVMVSEEILAHHAERKPLPSLPGKPGIQPCVGGYFLENHSVHEIGGSVPCELSRQFEVRSKLGMHMCIRSVRTSHRFCVPARTSHVHVKSFESISGAQAPTVGQPPVHGNLKPVRLFIHYVVDGCRSDTM